MQDMLPDTADMLTILAGVDAGFTNHMIGLGNVDDTADVAKPLSAALQVAPSATSPISNPTCAGACLRSPEPCLGSGKLLTPPM